MPRKEPNENLPYLQDMDGEIQTFLFRFLPELFSDIEEHLNSGFSDQQTREIGRYFHQVTNLCAIAYPHRYFLFFGTITYLRIRKLHRLFQFWCDSCASSATPSDREQLLRKMQDALSKLSRNYQVVSRLSLTKEQQKLLMTISASMNGTVRALATIGLKSVRRFAENTTIGLIPGPD